MSALLGGRYGLSHGSLRLLEAVGLFPLRMTMRMCKMFPQPGFNSISIKTTPLTGTIQSNTLGKRKYFKSLVVKIVFSVYYNITKSNLRVIRNAIWGEMGSGKALCNFIFMLYYVV